MSLSNNLKEKLHNFLQARQKYTEAWTLFKDAERQWESVKREHQIAEGDVFNSEDLQFTGHQTYIFFEGNLFLIFKGPGSVNTVEYLS